MTKGTILFCGWESENGIELAREYVRGNGYTYDDVRISRNGENILVIAKRDLNVRS